MSIQILHQMIAESAREPMNQEYSKYNVTLKEPQATDSYVVIKGLPQDAIVVKIDNFPEPIHFLKQENGLCKRADYAVFIDTETKKRVLIIEIKRGTSKREHLIKQFKGATCVLSYCKEAGKQFFNSDAFLDEFEYRYISFCKTSIRKQKTRPDKLEQLNNQPYTFWKINNATYLEFQHLVN